MHFDHVVVSRHGIVVIESQYARGWVSGTAVQDRWKQQTLGRTERFDNPLGRNEQQKLALQALLGYPPRVIYGIVVMVGQKGFKGELPIHVVEPEKLIRELRKMGQLLMEPEQAAKAISTIDASRLSSVGSHFRRRGALLAQALLALLLCGGLYLAFGEAAGRIWTEFQASTRPPGSESAGETSPDGSVKSEQEKWEESLLCAWSSDTRRCACYEPDGTRVQIDLEKCRALAERGSVLKQ